VEHIDLNVGKFAPQAKCFPLQPQIPGKTHQRDLRNCPQHPKRDLPKGDTTWWASQNCMFLGVQQDIKRWACVWSRVVQICGVLPCLSYELIATPQEGAKETCKIWTRLATILSNHDDARDQLFRNFLQEHVEGNTGKTGARWSVKCVPFDVLLFNYWETCKKVDHVRHRGLKEWSPIASIFCRSLSPLLVASQLTRRKDMDVLHKFAQP